MEQQRQSNHLHLVGSVEGEAAFSHAVGDVAFTSFFLSVERKSGVCDVLPVTAPAQMLPPVLETGTRVMLDGQLRAYRRCLPDGSVRVYLTAFAKALRIGVHAADENAVLLSGRLVRRPVYRETPSKREIADLLLLTPRAYGRLDCIPVIAWGRFARLADTLEADTQLLITGRFQSRTYQKFMPDGTVLLRTAYEVSAAALSVEDGTAGG